MVRKKWLQYQGEVHSPNLSKKLNNYEHFIVVQAVIFLVSG